MSTNSAGIVKRKRDRTNENFSKRLQTLLEKCDELVEYNADVYLLVRRVKLWEYTTQNCKCWPLSSKEIVSILSQVDTISANKLPRRITNPYRLSKHPPQEKEKKENDMVLIVLVVDKIDWLYNTLTTWTPSNSLLVIKC
jgi:hypothetical protein